MDVSHTSGATSKALMTACVGLFLTALPLHTALSYYTQKSDDPTVRRYEAQSIRAKPMAIVADTKPVVQMHMPKGAHIQVSRFRLEGVGDRPKSDVYTAELYDMLSERVAEQPPEGFTFGDLQNAARDVTRYYRERGFILARAIIPQQSIRQGVVTIRVVEGTLGQVSAQGNKLYTTEQLTRPFEPLKGQPVTQQDLEGRLLIVGDYPGLDMSGVLRKGAAPGTSDLVLQVDRERRYELNARLDNHGSEFTGEYRVFLDFLINNLTRGADVLGLGVLQTFDPAERTYGSISYERAILSPARWLGDTRWGVDVSKSAYDVAGELEFLDLEGDTTVGHVYLTKTFQRSRDQSVYGKVAFAKKKSDVDISGSSFSRDDLSVLELTANLDKRDSWHGFNRGYLGYGHGFGNFLGSMDSDSDPDASRFKDNNEPTGGEFDKLTAGISRWQPLNTWHNRMNGQALALRLEGQWTNDALVSLEQMAFGGPDSVRAYPTSEYLRDKGYFVSAEWVVDAPGFADKPAFRGYRWGDVLKVSLFIDHARGENNDASDLFDNTVSISGWGGALRFILPAQLQARLQVADKLSSREPSNDREPQVFFDVIYTPSF